MKFSVLAGDEKSYFIGDVKYEPGVDPELKRCPFCGSSDVSVQHTHTPYYWVECNHCEAQGGREAGLELRDQLKTERATRRNHERGFRSAIEAWNRRGPEDESPRPT